MTSLARIDVDSTVLIFTLLLSVLTAILFAWAPVFETSRASLSTTLGGTQSSIAGGSTRAQGLLISVEVALGQKHAYLATLLERVEQTPGAEAAGLAGATYHTPVIVGGARAADPGSPPPSVAVRMVSPA